MAARKGRRLAWRSSQPQWRRAHRSANPCRFWIRPPLDGYLRCSLGAFRASIELSRLTEAHLRTDPTLSPEDRVNLKFYVAMYGATLAAGAFKPNSASIK